MLTGCNSSGQTSEQKALTGVETEAAKLGVKEAKTNLPKAASTLQAPLDFFQKLLKGDRTAVMGAFAPEISSLTSLYDTGRKTAEEFAPRGGGRGAALEELPFKEAGDIEKLVAGARQEGATGVANIGAMLGQLGLGELGTGGSIASDAFSNIEASKENKQEQDAAAGKAVGSVIALLVGGAGG